MSLLCGCGVKSPPVQPQPVAIESYIKSFTDPEGVEDLKEAKAKIETKSTSETPKK